MEDLEHLLLFHHYKKKVIRNARRPTKLDIKQRLSADRTLIII